tara:strand:- start:50034 stop:51281 length:1248 start_codon:yes stop_codon:yes gene_type:complete
MVKVLIDPINGLILAPFVSYLVPQGVIPIISPGLAISALTFISIIFKKIINKKVNKLSKIWIIIFLMAINMSFVIANYNGTWLLILHLIQGLTPFFLFSLIVNNEKEARRVIVFWLIAFSLFSVLHIYNAFNSNVTTQVVQLSVGDHVEGYTVRSGDSAITRLANIRNNELGGFNPNVLGWLGSLYLPLAAMLGILSKGYKKKLYWLMFFAIVFIMIFTLSRAALLGIIMTFMLLIYFLKDRISRQFFSIFLPILLATMTILFIYNSAIKGGDITNARTISLEYLIPAIKERLTVITMGWKYLFSGQQTSSKFSGGTHSGFTKAALEFGLSYFFLYIIPFIYFIIKSFVVSKSHFDMETRLIGRGMLIAGIVAIIQGIFGITLFSSLYAQVFWLYIGYLYFSYKETKKFRKEFSY